MEGGTEFDLKAIEADDVNKHQLGTSSDKQTNNG